MNHSQIVDKYKAQIGKILGEVFWDIYLDEYETSVAEKFAAGKYQLRIGDTSDKKGVVVASFQLVPMINCCGILVSTSSFVEKQFRGLGLGTILNSLRVDIARELGYSVLMCTDIESNSAQRKILKSNGWTDIYKFVNKRTSNTVFISVINL